VPACYWIRHGKRNSPVVLTHASTIYISSIDNLAITLRAHFYKTTHMYVRNTHSTLTQYTNKTALPLR